MPTSVCQNQKNPQRQRALNVNERVPARMIVSDFTEVVLIDEAITDLQSQLSDLYVRRKHILHPTIKTQRGSVSPKIDFDTINLDLSTPLTSSHHASVHTK